MRPERMYMRDNGDRTFKTNFDSHRITFSGANFVTEKHSLNIKADIEQRVDCDQIVFYDGGGAGGYDCRHTQRDVPTTKEKLIYDEVVFYDGGGVDGYDSSKKNQSDYSVPARQ